MWNGRASCVFIVLCSLACCHCESVITFGTTESRINGAPGADNSAYLVLASKLLSPDSVAKFGNIYSKNSDGGRFSNLKHLADRYNGTIEEVSLDLLSALESDPEATQIRDKDALAAALRSKAKASRKRLILFADSLLENDEKNLNADDEVAARKVDALLGRLVEELESHEQSFRVVLTSRLLQQTSGSSTLLRRKRQAESEPDTYTLLNVSNCLLFYASKIRLEMFDFNDADFTDPIGGLDLPAIDKVMSDSFAFCDQPETDSSQQEASTTESPESTTESNEPTATSNSNTGETMPDETPSSTNDRKQFIEDLIQELPEYSGLKAVLDEPEGERQFAYIHVVYDADLPEPFNASEIHLALLFGRTVYPTAGNSYAVMVGSAWYSLLLANATFYYPLEPNTQPVEFQNITFRLPTDASFRIEAPFGYSFHCSSLQLFDTDEHNIEGDIKPPRGRLTFEDLQVEAFGDAGIQGDKFSDNVADCDSFLTPPVVEGVCVLLMLIVGFMYGLVMLHGVGSRTTYPPFDRSSATERERFRFVVNVPSDELQ